MVESARLRQWGVSHGFKRHVQNLCKGHTGQCVVHDHGIWLASNHAVAVASEELGLTRVVSPRGMLSKWSLGRRHLMKQVMLRLYQHRDLKSASGFQATSHAEADDIRAMGLKQPIAIIPNGVAFPQTIPARTSTANQMLCLSRLHPVKGLANLLNAFHQSGLAKSWTLSLVGPDENGHRGELESLAKELRLSNSVVFMGPCNDSEKWTLFANSDLFVLPSFTENFGISIAEAMAAGIPVITTKGTPWQILEKKSLGWWAEPSVDALKRSMIDATNLSPADRVEMGHRASEYARESFSWGNVGEKMVEFYRWLLGGAHESPDHVIH